MSLPNLYFFGQKQSNPVVFNKECKFGFKYFENDVDIRFNTLVI